MIKISDKCTNPRDIVMDQSVHKELPALFALAYDHSEEGRVKLIEKLAEIFLAPAATLTDHESKLVNELIEDLIKHGSPTVRQALVKEFAQTINASRDVAIRVAGAPIEISRAVLTSNENLTDEDLIDVVETKSTDHASAIATRKVISEAVADALVTTGDLRVMQLVAENLGAKLTSKSIEILVDSARLASYLQKPILSRPELNPESAVRLFWWVSQDLRREALDRYGFGPNKLDVALNKATSEILNALILQKDDDKAMYTLANWLEERSALSTKILPQLLRMEHFRLFNIALSRLSQLELPLIDLITGSNGGRTMVVLCRAIDIEKSNFVSIFLMSRGARKGEHIVHPKELSQALEAFDKLPVEKAKAMIECWRLDPGSIRQRIEEASTQKVMAN